MDFGEGSSDARECFIKFMWLDNLIELHIPPKFVKEHFASEEMEGVTLNGPCGKWDAKLEHRDDGVFIVQGWQDFVSTHRLGDHELAMFLYNGDMSFDVKIYEKSGWLRNYQTSPQEGVPPFASSFPFFAHKMKRHNVGYKCTMLIPKAFTRDHHLPMSRQNMVLKDSSGISWLVSIIVTSSGHLALSGGWKSFADAHDIKEGDVYIFELVERNVMQVHVVNTTNDGGIEVIRGEKWSLGAVEVANRNTELEFKLGAEASDGLGLWVEEDGQVNNIKSG